MSMGWPPGEVPIADCTLISACDDAYHTDLLKRIAESGCNENGDRRQEMARRALASANWDGQ